MDFSAVTPVTHAMSELLDFPITALRCVIQSVDDDALAYRSIFTLENHSLECDPPLNGRWVDLSALAEFKLFVESDRLSTIRNADQVLVLAAGEIVERGTHTELLEEQGAYYDLYMSQFRAQESVEVTA